MDVNTDKKRTMKSLLSVLMAATSKKEQWLLLLLQDKLLSTSLGLCILVFQLSHMHTVRAAIGQWAFCQHVLSSSVQQRGQKPPLKDRDSLDNPHYCFPTALVPQRCRISTHTSGSAASRESDGLTLDGVLDGRIDAFRFLTGCLKPHPICQWVRM